MARLPMSTYALDALLDELIADYPPRCLRSGETVEDHLRYAGKVDLVQHIRARLRPEEEDM